MKLKIKNGIFISGNDLEKFVFAKSRVASPDLTKRTKEITREGDCQEAYGFYMLEKRKVTI